jgi:hypothetical protein
MKTRGKGEKKERRSERDMLEETLELTRRNAERVHRPLRANPRVVTDLFERFSEALLLVDNREVRLQIMRLLDRPFLFLSQEAGLREPYIQLFRKARRAELLDESKELQEPTLRDKLRRP